MAWLRVGDTFAYDPRVVAAMEDPDADERTADEVCGYMMRLATLAAQHKTDYVVSFATGMQLAGTKVRAERLWEQAARAGYGEIEVDTDTGRFRFRFVDDPEFLHMRTRAEVEFGQQRKYDNGNPEIIVRVRHRDGEACRYCGNVVAFGDNKSALGATYDHRPPGQRTVGLSSVVACRGCNTARENYARTLPVDMQPDELLAAIDEFKPLLPPPWQPYITKVTADLFKRYPEILTAAGLDPLPVRAGRPVTAGRPAPGSSQPDQLDVPVTREEVDGKSSQKSSGKSSFESTYGGQKSTYKSSFAESFTAHEPHDSADPDEPSSLSRSTVRFPNSEPGRVGSGRVGPGRVETGRDGDGSAQVGRREREQRDRPTQRPRKKKRKGRRR